MSQTEVHYTRSTPKRGNHPYPLDVRMKAAESIIHGGRSPAEVAKDVGCSRKTAAEWSRKLVNNENMYEYSHRPPYISPKRKKKVLRAVKTSQKKTVIVSRKKLNSILDDAARKTSIEENKPSIKLSKRYKNKFVKDCALNEANAEVIDNAHEAALYDPRHAVSFAAMMHHLHVNTPPGGFVNIDKTSFDLRKVDQEKAPAVFFGTRPQSLKCDNPYQSSSHGNCSVHVYIVANDTGKVADIVYLVKDNNFTKDGIDVHPAPMLDVTSSTSSAAYLVFVGDSMPNKDAALSWLYENIVVPFALQLRTRMGKDSKTPISITIDGDPRQLQVVTEGKIRQAFSEANIILSKTPASCTPLFQPLDAGKLFLSAKTRFRKLVEDGYKPDNEADVDALLEIFREHRRRTSAYLTPKGKASVAIGNYFKDVIKCLYTVAAALRATGIAEVVRESFKSSGISPFNPAVIRDKCQYSWTEADKVNFLQAVPVLAEIFSRNFELKEKDFDEAGIPCNNDNKDTLAVHRRRALLLHAPHIVATLQQQASATQN